MRCSGLLLLLAFAGCYDAPRPACGFRCGPDGACPASYTCAGDGFCHANGSSPSLSCPLVDAGIDAFDFWPFIQDVSPLDDATAVPITSNVTVKFTEQVLGVSTTTFTLVLEGETTPIAATVTYDLPTRTATLDPDLPLRSSKHYIATLGDGIEDARGNPIYGKRTWRFKTAHDSESPSLISIVPADGATGVPINTTIVMTFTEQVQYPNGGFLLGSANLAPSYLSPTSLKFGPLGLQPNTQYTVMITAQVTDLTGNPFVPVSATFTTTTDMIPPTVVNTVPQADGFAAITTPIYAQFSEAVTGVDATSMSLYSDGLPIAATVTYEAAALRARLVPNAPLAPDASYTVILSPPIADANGNPLGQFTWQFQTDE